MAGTRQVPVEALKVRTERQCVRRHVATVEGLPRRGEAREVESRGEVGTIGQGEGSRGIRVYPLKRYDSRRLDQGRLWIGRGERRSYLEVESTTNPRLRVGEARLE